MESTAWVSSSRGAILDRSMALQAVNLLILDAKGASSS
jgi:hypothetical protein